MGPGTALALDAGPDHGPEPVTGPWPSTWYLGVGLRTKGLDPMAHVFGSRDESGKNVWPGLGPGPIYYTV